MKRSIDNGDYRDKQTPAFFSEKGKGYIIYYILLLIQLSDGVMFAFFKKPINAIILQVQGYSDYGRGTGVLEYLPITINNLYNQIMIIGYTLTLKR